MQAKKGFITCQGNGPPIQFNIKTDISRWYLVLNETLIQDNKCLFFLKRMQVAKNDGVKKLVYQNSLISILLKLYEVSIYIIKSGVKDVFSAVQHDVSFI